MSKELIRRFVHEEDAANAVEYGLITAVIAVALIAALVVFKDQIRGMFQRTGNQIRSST